MVPIPYLFFDGDCAEAFQTYAKLFGDGEPEIMPAGQMPPEELERMPPDARTKTMHAALRVGEGWIYGSDDMGGSPNPMAGCNVHLSFPDMDTARRVYDALAEGGEARMPLEPTFWSPGFGALTDRWGIRWMISVDAPA